VSSTKDSIDLQLATLQAVEVLRWWIRVDASDALDDVPHNLFADSLAEERNQRGVLHVSESTRQSSPAASEIGSRAPRSARVRNPLDNAEASARALSQAATDLGTLRSIMADFESCALKRTATQLVFADGIPGSRVMFVPWRPPGNRTPTPLETQICLPFIERQIHLADPEYLVCLGGSASRTILGIQGGIMRARGSWFRHSCQDGRKIGALAMLHPAFLLRQPAHKRFAWADMRALASALKRSR
jgi:uracil-DNA glycosylase